MSAPHLGPRPLDDPDWWRDAVVYQVYPRSFADSNGDGIGDLPGIISRLDYLSELGVDAIWISPFYASPLHDGGYDVADYRDVDPRLGTLADVDRLIAEAHARRLRVIMDIVPNHSSSEHVWFQEFLREGPLSPAAARYVVREGKGADKELPPNNWKSVFHGRGWSHVYDSAGKPTGYWYLHLFDTTQPDFNWDNPEVHAEFRDILRFWFDRGIDGFRIDVAHGLVKEHGLPDAADDELEPTLLGDMPHAPFWDQDPVHDIYREWRTVANEYTPVRIFCGETWVPNAERLARYQRPDELHTSFNFIYLDAGWDAERMRSSIDETLVNHAKVGAPPTWVLSNHDVIRHRTRLAPGFDPKHRLECEVDEERGLARARASTLFTMALPGSMYLYQGEEFGLPEVRKLDPSVRQDPAWHRSGGTDGLRDGCRVPIPWSGATPSFGFGPGEASWLPQPAQWSELSLEAERGVDGSTWEMYRAALALRRTHPALGEGPLEWLELDGDALALCRVPAGQDAESSALICVINFGEMPIHLPAEWGVDVLLASGENLAILAEDASEQVDNKSRDGNAGRDGNEGRDGHIVIGAETTTWLVCPTTWEKQTKTAPDTPL